MIEPSGNDLRYEAHTDPPERVAVIGASGYIGTNLIPRLVDKGFRVRAVARNPEVLAARKMPSVEIAVADVLEPETLRDALLDVDIAYYLIHCMRDGDDFEATEQAGAENFAQAAKAAGVKRIIYLGGLIPGGADSKHLVSRRVTGDLLRTGQVPVIEIRAGIIVGPGSASFEIIRDLVNHLPLMITPRWVRSKSPPIALENVLEYLVGVAQSVAAEGNIYDVAGPEMLSYEDLMRQYGECVGKHPWIIAVPVLTPSLSAHWLRLITAVPTSTARALIEGLKLHIQADDRAIRAMIPQRLLTYRESVMAVFDTEKGNATVARWTEGALKYRDYNPNYAFYAKRDSAVYTAKASPEAVWQQVASIGGKNRYFVGEPLWTIRETIDWALGGPGRSRGRRHPSEVRVGDAIDSWRVIDVEATRRLTLAFGMKAPGAAILEFDIAPVAENHTCITLNAYWHPAGVWGLLYWYAFSPSHFYIFNGLVREIARRAEKTERTTKTW
jgi:uncharacterized protein YbjT (DUF2867 family)/uncharacterized protein YndB with AHSA1/START domain